MYQLIKKYKYYSLHLMVIVLGFTGVFGKLITLDELHLVWYRMLIPCVSLIIFLYIKMSYLKLIENNF